MQKSTEVRESIFVAAAHLALPPEKALSSLSLSAVRTVLFAELDSAVQDAWHNWASEHGTELLSLEDLESKVPLRTWPEYPDLQIASRVIRYLREVSHSTAVFINCAEWAFCLMQEKATAGPLGHVEVELMGETTEECKGASFEPVREQEMASRFMRSYIKNFESRSNENIFPKVSICLTHFNYADELPRQLASLKAQTYTNIEVIVLDDGSTDPAAKVAFAAMQKEYEPLDWKFIEQENGYVGQARNKAASLATGELLVFADPDNVSWPDMVESFVQAITVGGLDAVTCWHAVFSSDDALERKAYEYIFTPLGPCLETGWLKNTFGDANFCVRRTVFKSLGGFTEDRWLGCEDWEFLAKLVLKGHSLGVVPRSLYNYRRHENSMFSTMDESRSHARAIRPYLDGANSVLKDILLSSVGTQRLLQQVEHQLSKSKQPSSSKWRKMFLSKGAADE